MLELAEAGIEVGIVTTEEKAMRDFYERLLGLAPAGEVPIGKAGRIVKLACGKSMVKLFVLAETPADESPPGHYLAAKGLRYFTIHIANLRTVMAACRDNKIEVVNDIVSPRPGILAALVADPDGNAIELMQIDG